MNRPIKSDYTSHVAYARALEKYCNQLEQPATHWEPVATVIQFDGEKIIDASIEFFDKYPIGTELFTSPPPTPELVQDVNQPDSTLGLLAYAANWIANPNTRKVSAGKLAAWLWNASHTHPGGKDDVDFWIKQATEARQAENQLIREMSDLVRAARQALKALEYQQKPLCMCFAGCDDCDPAKAPNADEAISALQNALKGTT